MFADRLKELREEKHIKKQEDLADILGLGTSTVSMYEQGRRTPSNETLQLIADYFNVSTDYLLCRTDERRPANKRFIPNNLTVLRGERSYEEYSVFLSESELDLMPYMIEYYENGKTLPDPLILQAIAEAEEIKIDYFYYAGKNINPDNFKMKYPEVKTASNSVIHIGNSELEEWINNPENLPYLEFIFNVYKTGITKDLLNHIKLSIEVNKT